ncbi:hypothetical protein QYB82_000144 [Clostridium perfringens]|nr:hypothetical protein [Clostridium perfringens]
MLNRQDNNVLGDKSILSGRDTILNFIMSDKVVSLIEGIPKVNNEYVERVELEKELVDKINRYNILQVYGMSGIGKTELVKKGIKYLANNYDKIYWLSCNLDSNIELDNIHTISGAKINILDKIKSSKVLIVLDNIKNDIKRLATIFNENNYNYSKLILISQEKSLEKSIEKLQVSFMKKEEVNEIFSEEEFQQPSFLKLIGEIEYHPMMLQILKQYLLDEDNGVNAEDFKGISDLVELQDSDISQSSRICNKIINDYYIKEKEVCLLLANLNSNLIEETFLKKLIVPKIGELTRRAFLEYNDNYYYLHDIVLNSIKTISSNEECKIVFKEKQIEYFEAQLEQREISFYRFVAYNNKYMIWLYEHTDSTYLKILIYNFYMMFFNNKNSSIHIENIKKLLENIEIRKYYEIKLYIEMLECIIQDREYEPSRSEKLENSIMELKKLLGKVDDTNCSYLIKHHIGKLYNWNRKYDESIPIFLEIIKNKPDEYTTYLQLLRAYRQKLINEKLEKSDKDIIMNKILNLLKQMDIEKMPVAIYLEVLKSIKNRPLNNKKNLELCLFNHFNHFKAIAFLYSKNTIFEHIYLIMGELSATISYNQQEFFKEWFKTVEHPNLEDCSGEILLSVIKIFCAEVKRRKYAGEESSELVKQIIVWWNKYSNDFMGDKVNVFDYKYIIEFYINIENFEMAEQALQKIYDEDNEWHLKYISEISKGKKQLMEALNYINKGIEIYKCKGDKYYISAFLNIKAEILYSQKNKMCVDILNEAIADCRNEKTKESWRNKLEKWNSEFN